jgi:GNAT superfamily N-acetyltransferase
MNVSDLRSVEVVAADELFDLRRRVLRGNDPLISVEDERDRDDDARHFAIRVNGVVVAAGSFYPSRSPQGDRGEAHQLRYLATAPEVQGRHFGTLLLRAAESRLASAGVSELWANGRDTAWGFYERNGWQQVPNSAHLSRETGLPHTVIYKTLRSGEPWSVDMATGSDAPQLARLREEMYFAVHLVETAPKWVQETSSYMAQGLADGSIIAAVARNSSGAVVSAAAATFRRSVPSPRFPRGDGAYVHSVSTLPAFRHRGISRALMERLLEELRSRGLEMVELHASWQGEGLYRALGFVDRTNGKELRLALIDEAGNPLS